MSKADEYRANAAECQRMADRADNDADRAKWLRLAQSWMMLVQGMEGDGAPQAEDRPAAPAGLPRSRADRSKT